MEQEDVIEDKLLKQILAVLKIPVEAFQNFDEEQAINIICNIFASNDKSILNAVNPIEKIVQLYDEKITLYERMLKEKDEMMVRL